MINRISTLRAAAKNLTSHLCMEGKTKLTKPGAIIPGAVAATGVVVTLETKDNSANITIQKDNTEIQTAAFNYNETPEGYELVSATSSFSYDDKDNKEIQQNNYIVGQEQEKSYEHSINYANAPIKENTRTYIDKINSSVAQTAGYQSDKIDYDPQESHTYGKKSLQRDIPALLKVLDIIAPNSEFTLKIKDKLKKDNKTSLVAFEANDTNDNGIVKGFISTNGDSVSYHIDTKEMTIIGEQSPNKDLSKAYLKPETISTEQTEIKEDEQKDKTSKKTTKKSSANKPSKQTDDTSSNTATQEANAGKPKNQVTHVLTLEYYAGLIFDTAMNQNLKYQEKVKNYKEILASAYLDGYNETELEHILSGNDLLVFTRYCKNRYIKDAIELANNSDVQKPAKTLDVKIQELQNFKINIEDEALSDCIQNMINIISTMQTDNTQKETSIDKALELLNNTSSENYESDLLIFIQEIGKTNDDMKLHYEIYQESVNNKKTEALKSQIESMIDNIPDTQHKERNDFLTQLYTTKDLKELEQLKNSVQTLLNEQIPQEIIEEEAEGEQTLKLSLKDLSNTNKKLVKKLLNCTSPKTMTLTFEETKNLLENIGFKESNVSGTHHKFTAPKELKFNGKRQGAIIITSHGVKTDNPALIDDLIRICRQYYGKEAEK